MRILILDSIHGGTELEKYISVMGHTTTVIDVYRGQTELVPSQFLTQDYDLAIVPVHLDPQNPWLKAYNGPVITHHAAVKWLIGEKPTSPMIEITGSHGKTTTAFALASVFNGPGILHTSAGDWEYPEKRYLGRTGITPASSIKFARETAEKSWWFISEMSLGLSGAGSLGIITSDETYSCANEKRDALSIKLCESSRCDKLIVAGKIPDIKRETVHVEKCTSVEGDNLRYNFNGITGSIKNPLLFLKAYKTPMALAAAAACMFSIDPSGLSFFSPVTGRLSIREGDERVIIDNSNSGTSLSTTVDAMEYARNLGKEKNISLVIGQDGHAVCEKFNERDIIEAIIITKPDYVILVEGDESIQWAQIEEKIVENKIPFSTTISLKKANEIQLDGTVVLSVKTWR